MCSAAAGPDASDTGVYPAVTLARAAAIAAAGSITTVLLLVDTLGRAAPLVGVVCAGATGTLVWSVSVLVVALDGPCS